MNSAPPPAARVSGTPTIDQAYQLLRSNRIDEADRACRSILEREPTQADALLIHALACLRRGATAEAGAALETALVSRPGFPHALYLRADLRRSAGLPREALADFALGLAGEWAPASGADPLRLLPALLEVIATLPPERWWPRMPQFQAFGSLLAAQASVESVAPLLDDAGRDARALATPDELNARFLGLAALLGFKKSSPAAWTHEVFERVALPWMQRSLAAGQIDAALNIEGVVYENYVKQTETEAHFEASFLRWKGEMRSAGQRFAATLPTLPRPAPGPVPRVAFFVHNVTPLAHVQMVLGLVQGNASLVPPRFEATVFCLSGKPEMLQRFRDAGVRVEVLAAGRVPSYLEALASLRKRSAELGIDVLVWVSLVLAMPLAFAMRLAPAQIWWALKYHRFESPDIDAYLTGGGIEGGFKTIDNRQWRGGSVPDTDWTKPEAAQEAAKIRARLGHRIVFGSFGREEKLDSPAFIDAVAKILRAVPDAGFLWTGRVQLPQIQERLVAAGVADRCHFIGWVDTKLYAQVIDVFLDSFPFPCGFTVYESMAAGKPAVFYLSAESVNTGANALIAPLLDSGDPNREGAVLARSIFRPGGEDYYLHATTPDEYIAFATRLAADAGYRALVGAACRGFVENFMADSARAARIYADHFDAVLAKARAGHPG